MGNFWGRKANDNRSVVWVTLIRVIPPNDIIIESLLRSQKIPYRLKQRSISQIPLAVGPYAGTDIEVPQEWEAEARQLLEPVAEPPDAEETGGGKD